MPQWVEDCVESVKPSLRKRYKKASDEEITSRAYAICNAAYKKQQKKKTGESEEVDLQEANCHKLAGDNARNYAIPRLKALPYRSDSGPSEACVRAAMARWNQVKGATSAEKSRARALLIRVAKRLGMKVTWGEE